ncbi:uncharacterized protein [Nicotiana tomentosiformis]|uniref:Uncharacterized protein isoform X2 n=1 Tax=Nicotiana tabacum TaxID=4097 RepID=A0A1S4CQ55_TOBAC|nr:uncharacterized protein LOC104120419 isoform X2 [Nicotiana tomentosiformis]XP_016503368.1 PREDICTED: uncharacterized protein LOC107821447 isoform X2 [Nicotiana tabacum]
MCLILSPLLIYLGSFCFGKSNRFSAPEKIRGDFTTLKVETCEQMHHSPSLKIFFDLNPNKQIYEKVYVDHRLNIIREGKGLERRMRAFWCFSFADYITINQEKKICLEKKDLSL